MPSVAAEGAFVVSCHDEAHGVKTRPFPEPRRFDWRDVLRTWTRSGRLRWTECRQLAQALGRDPSRPADDRALLEEFARRLRLEAERLNRPRFTKKQIIDGRIRNLAQQ